MTWYPAPGKLNLFLHVLGLRADGYHELQTVFRLIDLCDRVGIAPRSDGEVRFEGPFGEENLCVRAARLLQRETGSRRGAELRLEKHLPVGGGLGGGSSDAATVLLVLNRLWEVNLGRARLQEIGLQLGADVPFFIFGSNAVGEGIGGRLRALELPAAWYLVLTPQVSVSTKEMFACALTADLDRLMVFTGNANPRLAQDVAKHLNLPIGRAIVGKFSDGEVLVELIENVRGKDAFVLQSTCAPTNDNLMELLVMIDALKRSSAARVTAAIPYFGYARQDRRPRSARVAISAKVVANMLASVG